MDGAFVCVSHPLERIIPGVEFAPEIVGNGRMIGSIKNRL
jgi:hypothetical protein